MRDDTCGVPSKVKGAVHFFFNCIIKIGRKVACTKKSKCSLAEFIGVPIVGERVYHIVCSKDFSMDFSKIIQAYTHTLLMRHGHHATCILSPGGAGSDNSWRILVPIRRVDDVPTGQICRRYAPYNWPIRCVVLPPPACKANSNLTGIVVSKGSHGHLSTERRTLKGRVEITWS